MVRAVRSFRRARFRASFIRVSLRICLPLGRAIRTWRQDSWKAEPAARRCIRASTDRARDLGGRAGPRRTPDAASGHPHGIRRRARNPYRPRCGQVPPSAEARPTRTHEGRRTMCSTTGAMHRLPEGGSSGDRTQLSRRSCESPLPASMTGRCCGRCSRSPVSVVRPEANSSATSAAPTCRTTAVCCASSSRPRSEAVRSVLSAANLPIRPCRSAIALPDLDPRQDAA